MLKNTIRLRVMNEKGGQYFKAIITHPMEAGDRRDRSGKWIAPDYIENIVVSVDSIACFELALGENISSNPFIAFRFASPVYEGQILSVSWIEHSQLQTQYDCLVQMGTGDRFSFHSDQYAIEFKPIYLQQKPACKLRLAQQAIYIR